MEGASMFEDMTAAGSRLPEMVKELEAGGWMPFRHHDNWIHKDWLNTPMQETVLDTHQAYTIMKFLALPIAIGILVKELSKDKGEGSYYFAWQSNIAMAMFDEIMRSGAGVLDHTKIITLCNNAAKNFLDILCMKQKPEPHPIINQQ